MFVRAKFKKKKFYLKEVKYKNDLLRPKSTALKSKFAPLRRSHGIVALSSKHQIRKFGEGYIAATIGRDVIRKYNKTESFFKIFLVSQFD